MSDAIPLRALVVDDERGVRRLVSTALRKEGFTCDEAADGGEAASKLSAQTFDVVVTDLRMPNRHGHSLAVEVLHRAVRPLIIVHTAVLEPRLARDLIARGVDDIVFKPVDYSAFAAKVKALAVRRAFRSGAAERGAEPAPREPAETLPERVEWNEIAARLHSMSGMMPISQVALDVYLMSRDEKHTSTELVRAIQRDASLAVELLRIGNSAYYNPSGNNIDDLEEIVLRIGRRRIGEVALTTNALASLTANLLPWLDLDLVWRRSLAASVAVEAFAEKSGLANQHPGLGLCASLHSLGRIILGMLFPGRYEAILAAIRRGNSSLRAEEARHFAKNHAEVMATLLEKWNLAAEVCAPLRHVLDTYPQLNSLPTRIRTPVELVKLGVLVGRLAVGEWMAWDSVEIPPPWIVKAAGVSSLREAVETTERGLRNLLGPSSRDRASAARLEPKRIPYCSFIPEGFDFLATLLPKAGVELLPCQVDSRWQEGQEVLVNCLGASPERLAAPLRSLRGLRLALLCDADHAAGFADLGQTLALPCSFGQLLDFVGKA